MSDDGVKAALSQVPRRVPRRLALYQWANARSMWMAVAFGLLANLIVIAATPAIGWGVRGAFGAALGFAAIGGGLVYRSGRVRFRLLRDGNHARGRIASSDRAFGNQPQLGMLRFRDYVVEFEAEGATYRTPLAKINSSDPQLDKDHVDVLYLPGRPWRCLVFPIGFVPAWDDDDDVIPLMGSDGRLLPPPLGIESGSIFISIALGVLWLGWLAGLGWFALFAS